MYKGSWVVIVVICMAMWPFANSGKARDGGAGGASSRVLSERIEALERKIDRLEAKIDRLQTSPETVEANGKRGPRTHAFAAGGRGPCPGEWRRVGGGWVCTDPNAK